VKIADVSRKHRAIVVGGIAAGLVVSHALSDFVPDALGIGVGMFAAGLLAGFVAGVVWASKAP